MYVEGLRHNLLNIRQLMTKVSIKRHVKLFVGLMAPYFSPNKESTISKNLNCLIWKQKG